MSVAVSEVTRGRLVLNTAVTILSKGSLAVVAFVTTPLFLNELGDAAFGVWILVTTLSFESGYLNLSDLGFRAATAREVAKVRGRGEHDKQSQLVSTTFWVLLCLGVAIGGVLALSAEPLIGLFTIPIDLQEQARQTVWLVALGVAFEMPAAALQAGLEGAQRFSPIRIVEVAGRLVWATLSVVLVLQGRGIVALGASLCLAGALRLVLAAGLLRRLEPDIRISRWPSFVGARRLGFDGFVLVVHRITGVIWRQMDRIILGLAATAVAVAGYEVAFKVQAMGALAMSVGPSTVVPASAYLGSAHDVGRLRALYLRGTLYTFAVSTAVAIVGISFAPGILGTWVGDDYTDLSGMTRLFLTFPIIVSVHQVGLSMLVGLGRMQSLIALNVGALVINLVVSLTLVDRLGALGVVWGSLSGYVVLWLPYTLLLQRAFGVTWSEWVREVLMPVVPPASVIAGLGFVVGPTVNAFGQLWQVGIACAVVGAIGMVCFVGVGLPRAERDRVLAAVRSRSRSPVQLPPGQ